MARYIDENEVYSLIGERGTAKVHCSQIDELPRADVVPKSEVEKIFEEIDRIVSEYCYRFIPPAEMVGMIFDLKKKYTKETE